MSVSDRFAAAAAARAEREFSRFVAGDDADGIVSSVGNYADEAGEGEAPWLWLESVREWDAREGFTRDLLMDDAAGLVGWSGGWRTEYPRLSSVMARAYFDRWETLLVTVWDKAPDDGFCTFCGDAPVAGVRTVDGYRVCAACAADPDNVPDLVRVVQ